MNLKGGFPSSPPFVGGGPLVAPPLPPPPPLPLPPGGGVGIPPPPPPPPPLGVTVVGAVVVVDVPACDIGGCVVIVTGGAVVVRVVNIRGWVAGFSGGSMSIAVTGVRVGPSPRCLGTGLIVYHLFCSSQAINAHNRSFLM